MTEQTKQARLFNVCNVRVSTVDKHTKEGEQPVRLCNYVDVYKNEVIHNDFDFMEATCGPEEIVRFRVLPGDVLFTKDSETADDIGVPAFIKTSAPDLVCGYHVAIASPDSALVDPKFLFWFLSSRPARTWWETRASGVTRVGLRQEDIRHLPLGVLPPVHHQRAVADFLDRETAQIDDMIEAQQGVVDKLNERHNAAWAQAYHRLMGNAPERQVRNCVVSLVDGPFGSSLTSAHYADDGTRVIRLGNVGINAFKAKDAAFIDDEYAQVLSQHAARAGDVIFAGLGDTSQPLGRACVVPDGLGPAIVKADCYRLRPRHDVSARYLAWALSSPPVLAQNRELARGTTRQRMNTTLAKSIRIAIPSLEVQEEVVAQYDLASRSLSTAMDAAREVIDLLRERREALITAAVTGRIDPVTGIERIDPTTYKEAS